MSSRYTTFYTAARIKHALGAKEYDNPWDVENVDYKMEIMDELLDIYNYSTLDPKLKYMGDWARVQWNLLGKGEDV